MPRRTRPGANRASGNGNVGTRGAVFRRPAVCSTARGHRAGRGGIGHQCRASCRSGRLALRDRAPALTPPNAEEDEMSDTTIAAPVRVAPASDGEARWWWGWLAVIKLTGEQTDGRLTVVEL